jgi:mitochondrial fission protein ELM1
MNINSKWIQDLNIRPKTLQLIHERAGNTLEAIGIGKDFLSRTPAAQQLRERMNKWDYMKLKSFCITKEMVCKLKRYPQSRKKYLLAIHQRTDSQNIQGAQKTKLSKKINKPIKKWELN